MSLKDTIGSGTGDGDKVSCCVVRSGESSVKPMAESLFAAAFAAGVVEGGSLLWNAAEVQKDANDTSLETNHVAAIAASSLLYGTAALPMSILGASPGPVILSSLPYSPPTVAPKIETEPLTNAGAAPTESAPSPKSRRTLKTLPSRDRSTDQATESPPSPDRTKESQVDKRSELIRRTREENRKLIASVREKRQQQQSNVSVQNKSEASTTKSVRSKPASNMMNRYFSTLDGRPLATPLAEGMRRTRFLLVGAGLVTVFISNQSRKTQQEWGIPKEAHIQQKGKDAGALDDFVKKHPHGVSIRLMKDRLVQSGNNTVPFVLGDTTNVAASDPEPPLYWRLGRTSEEWKQIPLSEEWFVRRSGSSSPLLVVEADVSMPLSASIGSHNDERKNGLLSLESARFISRVIDMVAREKCSSSAPPSLVTILVGSGSKRPPSDSPNEVYVDGRAAVAAEVASFAEAMHKELVQMVNDAEQSALVTDVLLETETLKTETTLVAADEESANSGAVAQLVAYIDTIGEKIRKGGMWAVEATNFMVAQARELFGHDKVLHVFSDNRLVANWLRSSMSGWSVIWHDISSRDEHPISEHGGIAVVCCNDDETTSNTVCSMLSNDKDDAKETKVLAIMQNQPSVTALNWLVEGFTLNRSQKVLSISANSVDAIHNKLFAEAQQLLASGKTPAEVQELLSEK